MKILLENPVFNFLCKFYTIEIWNSYCKRTLDWKVIFNLNTWVNICFRFQVVLKKFANNIWQLTPPFSACYGTFTSNIWHCIERCSFLCFFRKKNCHPYLTIDSKLFLVFCMLSIKFISKLIEIWQLVKYNISERPSFIRLLIEMIKALTACF